MAITPWKTSNSLVETISRKISLPISQATFSAEDILAFATEELMISQVPSVMTYHEEYFVWQLDIPLTQNQTRYPIPDRAIGMKLRDIFYKDTNNNLYEMTLISPNDKAFFQENMGTYQTCSKYFLQNNEICLSPYEITTPTGFLNVTFFLRPNILVPDERAAIIQWFTRTLTVDNSQVSVGDTLTINGVIFEAVDSAPTGNQFLIGIDSLTTAANLASAIVLSKVIKAAGVGTPATNIVTLGYLDLANTSISVSGPGFLLQDGQGIQFVSIPDQIVGGSVVDLLQTKPGHSMRAYGVQLTDDAVGGNIINFAPNQVPMNLISGDYVCLENECIIPQIPTDLHSGLAERTCTRILAALGDQAGMAASAAKVQEIDKAENSLLGSRVEGSPKKVVSRHSLLSMGKMSYRRRY